MKAKTKWMSLLVAGVMLLTAISPVFAEDEPDPNAEPGQIIETPDFSTHPIVKLLASYFAGFFTPITEEPGEGSEGEGDGEGEDEGEGTTEPLPVVLPEEGIATLHTEQELGFGVIIKLLQLASEAGAICDSEQVNCDLTLDGLVAEFKSGIGIGQLFKKYGKTELLGIGHIRQEMNLKEKSNHGKGKGRDNN